MTKKNMKLVDYIPEYEAQTGEKVSAVVARFAEQMDIVGQRFEAKGHDDASRGLPVPVDDVFREWSKKLFEDDSAMAGTMADIIRLYYMDGYREGGADNGK